MFLFHSCNHALTPHFHQFMVLGAEQTTSVSNPLPNNSLERTGDFALETREICLQAFSFATDELIPGRSARSR